MTPPRLRLRLVDPPMPVPEDSPRDEAASDWRTLPTDAAPANPGPVGAGDGAALAVADSPDAARSAPVPEDSPDVPRSAPVLADSPDVPRSAPVLADSSDAARSAPVLADSPLSYALRDSLAVPVPAHGEPLVLTSAPTGRAGAAHPDPLAPAPTGDPAVALAELERLLADPGPPDDATCERLAALALAVPGRQRLVTAALARAPGSAGIACLRALPAATPGLLEALVACFARGAPRLPPVPGDSPAPLLALDLRGSRARGFPDLVARAQAIAQASPAAEFAAFDLDARRHYRLTFWPDRSPTAALAAQLRAALPDLVWLHGRLVRLRGSRLWLAGWRFDADDPLGPAAQARLLHVWLRGWLDRARESAA